jgi:hypothetical protein
MAGEVVILRIADLMPIEAAAQILAWIVYPTDQSARERWADAIVSLAPHKSGAISDSKQRCATIPNQENPGLLRVGDGESHRGVEETGDEARLGARGKAGDR